MLNNEIKSKYKFEDNKIISENNLHDIMTELVSSYPFDMLKEIVAIDYGNENFELIYRLFSSQNKEDLLLSARVNKTAQTVTDIFKSAIADENEIYDLFGIEFIGNKELQRLYLPESWEGFPLRKDYIENDDRLAWNDNNA